MGILTFPNKCSIISTQMFDEGGVRMNTTIGAGRKHVRDFAIDFTNRDTYIGGRSFPKGYFTVAVLNYGKETITKLLYAGAVCNQAMADMVRYTLRQTVLMRWQMRYLRSSTPCQSWNLSAIWMYWQRKKSCAISFQKKRSSCWRDTMPCWTGTQTAAIWRRSI